MRNRVTARDCENEREEPSNGEREREGPNMSVWVRVMGWEGEREREGSNMSVWVRVMGWEGERE